MFQVIGEFAHAVGDAFEFGMGVSHGHAEIGVTHRLLDDRDGNALLGENGRVCVTQGVNVNDPIHRVAFVDSGKSEIAVQDFIEPGWHLKQFLLRRHLAFLLFKGNPILQLLAAAGVLFDFDGLNEHVVAVVVGESLPCLLHSIIVLKPAKAWLEKAGNIFLCIGAQ